MAKGTKRKSRLGLQLGALGVLWALVLGMILWVVLDKHSKAPTPETALGTQAVSTLESTTAAPAATEPPTEPPPTEPPVPEQDWRLLLVNGETPLPEDFSVTLKELRNQQQVDERIYPELQQMFDDARAEGYLPYINESFRTAEDQQDILDRRIAQHEAEGLSHEEALQKALDYVARPGYSEHQTGLALDIISEDGGDSTPLWQWLRAHARDYGFILRYPEGKEALTGIAYEPWHYRYVGVEAAREMEEAGICLEEYLAE